MSRTDDPFTPPATPDPVDAARRIAVETAALGDLAQQVGLEIVARLLNLVRIEAEIKLSEIKFRPPSASRPHNQG